MLKNINLRHSEVRTLTICDSQSDEESRRYEILQSAHRLGQMTVSFPRRRESTMRNYGPPTKAFGGDKCKEALDSLH